MMSNCTRDEGANDFDVKYNNREYEYRAQDRVQVGSIKVIRPN